MILASCNAIPKNIEQAVFLKGPAKVYDGAFDYDDIALQPFDSSQPKSYCLVIHKEAFTANNFEVIYYISTPDRRSSYIAIENNSGIQGRLRYQIARNSVNNRIITRADTTILQPSKKYIIIITDDGSNSFAGINIYINGIQQSLSKIDANNTITPFTISPSESISKLGTTSNNNQKFSGQLKQFEKINRIATAQELADASDPLTGGSFRASGIAHNSGQYQLAVDFNQTDGNPPTTFADTPFYNITSFGGAQYVNYEDL